jgi:hypothetical protein
MRRSSFAYALALTAVFATAPAFAQTPTEAQQKALRANCPSDFREYCSGVPTGGMDALVCLEKNVDNLSPGCKSAVEAVDTPAAAAPAAPAPAASMSAAPSTSSGGTTSTASSPTPSTAAAPQATPAPPTPPESVPPAARAPAGHEPPLTLRQEMALAAGACAVDFRLLCPNLPVGHGNILFCLKVHGPRLAPACHDALLKAGVSMR